MDEFVACRICQITFECHDDHGHYVGNICSRHSLDEIADYFAKQACKKAAATNQRIRGELHLDFRPTKPYESIYELTITTTKDDPYELRQIIFKIAQSAMFEVVSCAACIELTKAGLPHIHAILYSKRKYLDASKIKRFTPYRYELKRVRNESAYTEYIKKEKDNLTVSTYCEKKGIPQFFNGTQEYEESSQEARGPSEAESCSEAGSESDTRSEDRD